MKAGDFLYSTSSFSNEMVKSEITKVGVKYIYLKRAHQEHKIEKEKIGTDYFLTEAELKDRRELMDLISEIQSEVGLRRFSALSLSKAGKGKLLAFLDAYRDLVEVAWENPPFKPGDVVRLLQPFGAGIKGDLVKVVQVRTMAEGFYCWIVAQGTTEARSPFTIRFKSAYCEKVHG